MFNKIAATSAGLALMALAGSANALTFNEGQNTSFGQYFSVTPSANNKLLFSVSGNTSQFDALSFSFVGVSGLAITATPSLTDPSVWMAAFNDIRNNGFNLSGSTTYQVKVSGHTVSSIPGGEGTVSVVVLNGIISSVPEPESYAMLLAGLGLLGVVARRRAKAAA
jgi:hypothetical protein